MTELERLELKELLKIQVALGKAGYIAVAVDRLLGDKKIVITAYQHTKKIYERAVADTRKKLEGV
jgi:recombinational DNA repair protein (RecF pathway)